MMKVQKKWMAATVMLVMAALFAGGFVIRAQDPPKEKGRTTVERDVLIEREEVILGDPSGTEKRIAFPPEAVALAKAGGDDTMMFVSAEMSFGGKVVKGAPYSAQAVTETIQTLGDGNRIVRKNTAAVYRDSEGRTRRDQTLGAIGPFAEAGDPPQTFFINDPVAGVNYILDPRSRTARKLTVFHLTEGEKPRVPAPGVLEKAEVKRKIKRDVLITPAPGVAVDAAPQVFHYTNESSAAATAKTEALGKQLIEGVEAEGKRTTRTIAAGQIGNEQPIQIVAERWYSPELQTVVMTRHSDPRFGETTFRLTNINRSEPSRALFDVPADYTIKEGPETFRRMMKKLPNEK